MRKIIEIVAGRNIDLMPHGIDLRVHKIERLWTVYAMRKDSLRGVNLTTSQGNQLFLRI